MKLIQNKLVNVELDHRIWLNEITFAFKEIMIYQDRILDLIDAYKGKHEESELGLMLLSFIEQKLQADQIKEQIQDHLKHMKAKIHANGELKAIIDTVHHKTREDIEFFRKEYKKLKEELYQMEAFQN